MATWTAYSGATAYSWNRLHKVSSNASGVDFVLKLSTAFPLKMSSAPGLTLKTFYTDI